MKLDPERALELLASSRAPHLVGVRHHSPACAAALPALLDELAPEQILLELPPEMQRWIEWLAKPDLQCPVALAGVSAKGEDLSFYPFADFSPELAAIRWAAAKDVPVQAFDLPIAARPPRLEAPKIDDSASTPLLDRWLALEEAPDSEALWDRVVEARAPGSSAERLRRAALLFGFALRLDSDQRGGVSVFDLRRETFMRQQLEDALCHGSRVVAVVGAFLERLSALREGFDVLSTASRQRLLEALGERLGDRDPRRRGLDVILETDPALLARFAAADKAGRDSLAAFGWQPPLKAPTEGETTASSERSQTEHSIAAIDRWRLILGRERDRVPPNLSPYGRALDELYGEGRGEGSRGYDSGSGGGKEESFPTVREWSEELAALFGEGVREEVLGKAAALGRPAALLELDPEQVTPSVELLEQVLSLKGGLPEAHLGPLRRLVARVVDELVRELATRLRPALMGVTTPRPTIRPTGRLDVGRTIRRNLATIRRNDEGDVVLVPEKLVFRSRARRSLDWHIVLCVDVSGSMEPSVIYSAMMAAILSGLPAVSVSFFTFSTEVIDLSDHVDDPLALLLEVDVGGGTHIAKALKHARSVVRVPSRTILFLVSDFEEGYAVDALLTEVRALVEVGVTTLGLAALDDRGQPRYSKPVAEAVAGCGMPVAALTPLELARWVGEVIR